jgi:hypothetical protein
LKVLGWEKGDSKRRSRYSKQRAERKKKDLRIEAQIKAKQGV